MFVNLVNVIFYNASWGSVIPIWLNRLNCPRTQGHAFQSSADLTEEVTGRTLTRGSCSCFIEVNIAMMASYGQCHFWEWEWMYHIHYTFFFQFPHLRTERECWECMLYSFHVFQICQGLRVGAEAAGMSPLSPTAGLLFAGSI